jgi:histidinol-phosphate phosphatase family protein
MKAAFIDRDGTIGGSDQVEYPGEFELYPQVRDALEELKQSGMLICSFTNQPGISRGEATKKDFEVELKGFGFDRVYLCPHQHGEGCNCRKPSTGMLEQAAQENGLDLKECVVIGDRWTDMMAAHRVGCKKVLVKTGAGVDAFSKYQSNEYYGESAEVSLDYVASNFQEAVEWIVEEK